MINNYVFQNNKLGTKHIMDDCYYEMSKTIRKSLAVGNL